jgi:translocator protein
VAAGGSSILLLVASLALVALVAAAGGAATAHSVGDWYEGLDRAPWNPPGWVFGPAWTVLYVLMAVAAWLVGRHGLDDPAVRTALLVYGVQLALNLGWSLAFFGLRRPWLGLAVILLLLVAIAVTAIAFHRIVPVAGWLLAPYLVWVAFATTLNAWVALAN